MVQEQYLNILIFIDIKNKYYTKIYLKYFDNLAINHSYFQFFYYDFSDNHYKITESLPNL